MEPLWRTQRKILDAAGEQTVEQVDGPEQPPMRLLGHRVEVRALVVQLEGECEAGGYRNEVPRLYRVARLEMELDHED